MKKVLDLGVGVMSVLMLVGGASTAVNAQENQGWQFRTSADRANNAAVEDMRQRKRSGYYAAPIYTTNIDRQYNCTVSAAATGNDGTTSAVANSPSTAGANSSAVGNSNDTDIDGAGYGSGGSASNSSGQSNDGSVGSSVRGSTNTDVRGSASQVLNSNQSNSGNQAANVQGASGCSFAGALN